MKEVARSIVPAGAARRRPPSASCAAFFGARRRGLRPRVSRAGPRDPRDAASPVRVAFLWTISWRSRSRSASPGSGASTSSPPRQGKFEPTGRVKVIEPVETGRVAAIHVVNDSEVRAGDVLVELDPSAANADVNEAGADLASAEAESVRRGAALAAGRARDFAPPAAIAWPGDIAAELRAREERVLAADLGQLSATVASFAAQTAQKTAERDMLDGDHRHPAEGWSRRCRSASTCARSSLASQSGAKSA